ncbi:MAG TPA: regulatory protein RecX [Cyclobacteriaceae bacterium]|nr:regulatory protein RecX [Cyclobacteriaceae bacterium]
MERSKQSTPTETTTRLQNQKSSAEIAARKIFRYCAYQERSHQEVRNKLFEYGLRSNQVEEILSRLITDGFLNEERYARAFAGGKFRMMKWGKLKIQRELESAGVSPRNIAFGLAEIDPADYSKSILSLVKKKATLVTDENLYKKKNKIARFVIGKGYEPDLVWEALNDFLA